LEPSYNIAPTQRVMAVLEQPQAGVRQKSNTPSPSGRVLTALQWGLVPAWAKDPSIGAKLINARGESLGEKPSFHSAFRDRRCLIPASGFYEWRKGPMGKQPMYAGLRSKQLFAMAGLYESWTGPGGQELRTCTIITTTPNQLLKPIHDRMPVIIPPEKRALWLDATIQDPETLEPLLALFPAKAMEAYPVSKRVNSPSNTGAELARPLAGLDLGL